MNRFLFLLLALGCAALSDLRAQIAQKVARDNVAGIDLLVFPTDVEKVVTFRGSLPAGDAFSGEDNMAVPTLVGGMLDKGTTAHDKFEIAQQLDSIGAKIAFSVEGVMTEFSGKCLRKDLPLVLSLLAEMLRTPAFSPEEFAKLKKQIAGNLQRALESTDYRAGQAFSENLYPVGHPNYSPPVPKFLEAVDSATLDQVKKFHSQYYGPAGAALVVVGDVDPAEVKAEVARAFDGWTGGVKAPEFPKAPRPSERNEQTVAMADKPNVSVMIGQPTGLKYRDPDALALRIGTAVLGSGFTGRLMANVRDKEGLTYGIGSGLAHDSFTDGDWRITANFAPALLERGLASAQRQLDSWYAGGVTPQELDRVKSNIIGTFKVGLATTDGMANALLTAIHRGYDVTWLDEFPKRVAALTLDEVNTAIKNHLSPDKMTVIKAGSVPPPQDRK